MTALSPLLACLTVAGRLAGWALSWAGLTTTPIGPNRPERSSNDPLAALDDLLTRQAFLLDPLYDHDERTRQP